MNKMTGLNGKRRGQAFETMMLVISVIVAVAILGVLLGFLGNIGFNVANAKTVIPDLIKKVSSEGFGVEAKENVDFSQDDVIYVENMIKGSSIPAANLQICVGSNLKSGDTPLKPPTGTITGDSAIEVKSAVRAAIAACKGKGLNVRISIYDTQEKAVADCTPTRANNEAGCTS